LVGLTVAPVENAGVVRLEGVAAGLAGSALESSLARGGVAGTWLAALAAATAHRTRDVEFLEADESGSTAACDAVLPLRNARLAAAAAACAGCTVQGGALQMMLADEVGRQATVDRALCEGQRIRSAAERDVANRKLIASEIFDRGATGRRNP
jgi:hypothetical protein